MFRCLVAVSATIALSAPAIADDLATVRAAIADARLSSETDLLMWCAAAFSVASVSTGDEMTKKAANDMAAALFTKAAPLLAADGVGGGQLPKFGGYYGLVVRAEILTHAAAAEHTQDECTAAMGR